MSTAEGGQRGSLRPFFILWSGQAISLYGSAIVQFALIWWLTQETGSATILAAAALVGLLPQVLLGPFVGVLVDRWSRRWVMAAADSMIALATILLALLFWLEVVAVWHLFGLMFLRAVGGAFHHPAMQSSTALMVPHDQLTRIQGLNQMLEGSLNIISAPLGALVLSLLPMQGVLAIDVVTAVFAIIPLLFIAVPQPPQQEANRGAPRATFWQEMRLGMSYLWSWPGMLLLMGVAMMINLMLTPAASLMPLLVTEHFLGDAFQLSFLHVAFGVGIISGGVLLGIWGGFKRRIFTSLGGMIGLGFGFFLMGMAPANLFSLAIVGATVAGVTMAITNGPVRAIFQVAIAPDMQGRVLSLLRSLSMVMSPLGLIIAGPAADLFGIQTWYIIGGAVTLLMGIVGFFIPALVHVEDGRDLQNDTVQESDIPAGAEPVSTGDAAVSP